MRLKPSAAAARAWSTGAEPSGFSAVLRDLCGRHGFRFLDLKPWLVEAPGLSYEKSGALLWWSDDTRWNGEGQRAAASAVCANLRRDATPGPDAQATPSPPSTSVTTRGARR